MSDETLTEASVLKHYDTNDLSLNPSPEVGGTYKSSPALLGAGDKRG
jgi:hypothetical protein